MGPPSLFIWFRESQAFRKPNDDVIVQSAALLEFGDPDVMKAVAAPTKPMSYAFEKLGDVPRSEAVNVSIGKRQHGRTHPDSSKRKLEKFGRNED